MAYVQTPSTNRRTLTIGAVAALHAALLYALLTGFSVAFMDVVEMRFPTTNYPADPPPPSPQPTVEPSQAADKLPLAAPRPDIDLGPRDDGPTVIELYPLPQPTAQPGLLDLGPTPLPSPSAAFTPRAATPLGKPGNWVSSDDYPAAELRLEHEGIARFRVTIGADGRVRNCEITVSSGFAGLDRATCAKIAERARFRPAIDETGAAVSGSYSSAVKWEIPD